MTTRVEEFCKKYSMLEKGTRILCAVSGGADSMAMLHVLREIGTREGFELVCAHYNHGIRGEEALRDEKFVEEECRSLGVPYAVGHGDVPAYAAMHRLGLEAAGRELRYAFLEECAGKYSCGKIATAHNAADNAETFFLNLLRGAGLRGLCGIAPVRGRLIRPLLCLDRPEIEDYLAKKSINFVTDSTNLTDDYSRNRLRHAIIEPLRAINDDFGGKILAACESLREDEDYLETLTDAFLASQGGALSAEALAAAPKSVSKRSILRLSPGAGREHVEKVLALAESGHPHGSVSLPGLEVLRQYDALFFGASGMEHLPEAVLLSPEDKLRLGKFSVSCHLGEKGEKTGPKGQCFNFKSEEICGNITIGARKEGDKLRPKGRGVTKSLKKLFSEAKIPPAERENIPVLRDSRGVLGVYGFGEDERVAAESGEGAIIIEIKKCAEDGRGEK